MHINFVFVQLLRPYDSCPTYTELIEDNKSTKEYQQKEVENRVCELYTNIVPTWLESAYVLH